MFLYRLIAVLPTDVFVLPAPVSGLPTYIPVPPDSEPVLPTHATVPPIPAPALPVHVPDTPTQKPVVTSDLQKPEQLDAAGTSIGDLLVAFPSTSGSNVSASCSKHLKTPQVLPKVSNSKKLRHQALPKAISGDEFRKILLERKRQKEEEVTRKENRKRERGKKGSVLEKERERSEKMAKEMKGTG